MLVVAVVAVVGVKLAMTNSRRRGAPSAWTSSDTLPVIYGDSVGEPHHHHDGGHSVAVGSHHVDIGSHHA